MTISKIVSLASRNKTCGVSPVFCSGINEGSKMASLAEGFWLLRRHGAQCHLFSGSCAGMVRSVTFFLPEIAGKQSQQLRFYHLPEYLRSVSITLD